MDKHAVTAGLQMDFDEEGVVILRWAAQCV